MTDGERCPWCLGDALYQDYHDREWGVPEHRDQRLFEFLILEGAQAGLSWITVLRKRENYRRLMCQFEPEPIAAWGEPAAMKFFEDFTLNGGVMLSSNGEVRRRVSAGREGSGCSSLTCAFIAGRPPRDRGARPGPPP